MTFLDHLRENVGIALDTLRVSKLGSSLTILGVVIGVSTVMAMAAIVSGIQKQIVETIEVAGPSTFSTVYTASDKGVSNSRPTYSSQCQTTRHC